MRTAACRGAGGEERDEPQAGQILKVIRHERVPHRVHVEEAEGGKQRAREDQHGHQGSAPDAAPRRPQRGHRCQCSGGEEVRWPAPGIDLPARIVEHELCGPQQLVRVEPQRPARDETAIDEREIPIAAHRTHVLGLQLHGERAESDGQHEERQEEANLGPADAAALPPEKEQNHRRQRAGHGLAEEGARERRQRQRVEPARLAVAHCVASDARGAQVGE